MSLQNKKQETKQNKKNFDLTILRTLRNTFNQGLISDSWGKDRETCTLDPKLDIDSHTSWFLGRNNFCLGRWFSLAHKHGDPTPAPRIHMKNTPDMVACDCDLSTQAAEL